MIQNWGDWDPPPTSNLLVTFGDGNRFLEKISNSFAIPRIYVCREFDEESIGSNRMSAYAFLEKFVQQVVVRISKSEMLRKNDMCAKSFD